jgi:hypothetical protein
MIMPPEEEIKKALGEAGDGCGICNREQLWNGETTTTGLFRGKLCCVGECCVHRLRSITGVGIYYGGPNKPWTEDDRKWFETHPVRKYRLRRSFSGESTYTLRFAPNAPKGTVDGRDYHKAEWFVVTQLKPGVRRRIPVCAKNTIDLPPHFNGVLSLPDEDQEAVAHALALALVDSKGYFKGSAYISLTDIMPQFRGRKTNQEIVTGGGKAYMDMGKPSDPILTRHQWDCNDCNGVFEYPPDEVPNFCPYCHSKNLAIRRTHRVT